MTSISYFDSDCQVRTYPDLSAFVLKSRLDLPYRLWLLLRPAYEGRGWLTLADILDLSVGNRRQTKTWLARGVGTFWHWGKDGNLYLHGLEKVCVILGIPPKKPAVAIPREDLENLQTFRAQLFNSWFADKPRTISQGRLGEIFGRKPRTLRRWSKLTELEVKHNLAWAPLPDPGDDLERYPDGTLEALTGGAVKTWRDDPRGKPNDVWVEHWSALPGSKHWDRQNYHRGGNPVLVWRFPNTYRSSLGRGPKTRLQREAVQAVFQVNGTSTAPARYIFHRGPGQANGTARALQRDPHIAFMEEGTEHYGYGLFALSAL